MTTYPLPSDQLWHSLKEGSEFFQHEGDIYETLRRLVEELEENLDASVRDEYRRLWQNAQAIPPEE